MRSQSTQTSRRWKNFVIVSFLVIIGIDSFPATGRVIGTLRRAIDPVIDVVGIWQGKWDLFGPDIDKHNNWIEARFYVDHEPNPVLWRSPDWRKTNCFGKFRKSREIELFDRIRNESNSPAWPTFAHYLMRQHESGNPGKIVKKVELISATERIPSPSESGKNRQTFRDVFYTLDME